MQLWLIGGYPGGSGDSDYYKTTEFIDHSGTTPGPVFPEEIYRTCASYINATHAIVTTVRGSIHSYIVDLNDNFAITEGPTIDPFTYADSGCARFMHPNGTNFVILAGGESGYHADQTELISDANFDTWLEGKIITYLW